MTTVVVRRLYLYAAAFIGLQILAGGLRMVVGVSLERLFWPGAITSAQLDISLLSFSVALLVVGAPLWAVHWFVIQRGRSRPEEQHAALRRLYGYAVLLVAMLGLLFAARTLVIGLLGAAPADGAPSTIAGALAAFAVDALIWLYHWRVFGVDRALVETAGGPATLRRWYLVIVQAFGLGMASYAAADLLHQLLRLGLSSPIGDAGGARTAVASLIAGLAVWLPHHLWGQRLPRQPAPLRVDEARSTLRQVYAALVVTTAAVATLGGLGVLLAAALLALFGGAAWSSVLQDHTQALATALIALPLWRYHQALIRREAGLSENAARTATARRLIDYLTAAIGLGALFFGLGGLLSTLLRLGLAPDALGSGWRDALSFNLALAIIALPVYLAAARSAERRASGAPAEARTLARRVYLYAALLFGVIALIVAVVALLRIVIASILGAAEPNSLAEAGRWLGYAVIGAVIAAYHLSLLRRVGASRETGAGLTVAILADEGLRALLGEAFKRELPAAALHLADPADRAGVARALADAGLVIVSLAAALDDEAGAAVRAFHGRRLLLATAAPGYELAGAQDDPPTLARETVRRVREGLQAPAQTEPAAPPAPLPAG